MQLNDTGNGHRERHHNWPVVFAIEALSWLPWVTCGNENGEHGVLLAYGTLPASR